MKKTTSKKATEDHRTQTFEVTLPLSFYRICKMLNVEPRK